MLNQPENLAPARVAKFFRRQQDARVEQRRQQVHPMLRHVRVVRDGLFVAFQVSRTLGGSQTTDEQRLHG